MILWLIIYYLLPALFFSGVSAIACQKIFKLPVRMAISIFFQTISWSPLIITFGHGTAIAQSILAVALHRSGWLARTPVTTQFLMVLTVFIIVMFVHVILGKLSKDDAKPGM